MTLINDFNLQFDLTSTRDVYTSLLVHSVRKRYKSRQKIIVLVIHNETLAESVK